MGRGKGWRRLLLWRDVDNVRKGKSCRECFDGKWVEWICWCGGIRVNGIASGKGKLGRILPRKKDWTRSFVRKRKG